MSVTLTFDAARRKPIARIRLLGRCFTGATTAETARAVPDKIAVVDNHGASRTTTPHSTARQAAGKLVTVSGVNRAIAWPFSFRAGVSFTLIYLACLKTGAVSPSLLPRGEAELVLIAEQMSG